MMTRMEREPFLPLVLLREYFQKGITPEATCPPIDIYCAENI